LPCGNCSALNYCLSCITNYLTNGTCVNASLCPNGTFANTSTLICDSCSINCGTCSSTASNCTSCSSPYFFYNGTCVSVCPNLMYSNSSTCLLCQAPCANCSSISFCLSCISSYLYNGTCLNATACPSGTYANTTNYNC